MKEINPVKKVIKKTSYENNPFFIATNGIELLFKKAQSVATALVVLSVLGFLNSFPRSAFQNIMNQPQNQPVAVNDFETAAQDFTSIPIQVWILGFLVLIAVVSFILFIGIVIRGVSDYTSAQLAQGKSVTLMQAIKAVFSHFWSYTWVLAIVSIKTFLWSLLFIIPGIIMAYRYSLAGVSFFAGNGRGDAAVQHSSQLVKGAWLTTYASTTLLSILTLGFIKPLILPSANAILYRQLVEPKDKKPHAHWLSWAALFIMVLITLSILAFFVYMLPWIILGLASKPQ